MSYTLITAQGQIFQFFLETVARQFQQAYGGTVITNQVFETETV